MNEWEMKEWEGWGIYESLFRIIWGNNWGGGGGWVEGKLFAVAWGQVHLEDSTL